MTDGIGTTSYGYLAVTNTQLGAGAQRTGSIGAEFGRTWLLMLDLVAHRLDQGTQTKIASPAKQPFAGADDQGQGFGGEGSVAQPGAVELAQDELLDGFGRQALQHYSGTNNAQE